MLVAEPLPEQALDSAVSPAEIVQQTFDVERRGFDQRQVQQYLRAVAESLQDAQQREADIRLRLGKAVRRAETAEKSLLDVPRSDPSDITRQIGDEVTTVLDAARAAGEQRVVAAEKSAERLMASAKAEATEIRAAAETIMDERRAEADAAAADIISQANSEAVSVRDQAEAKTEAMITDTANRMAQARDECDELIREAEEARAQILEDMERRRRQARAQVERLRVGRDRLLRSYEVVRRTLEETTVELKSSLQEAKVRGDTAARLVEAEPLADRNQLEAEIADAKMIGRLRLTPTESEAKALRSPALPRQINPPQMPNIDLRAESAPTPRKPRVGEVKKGAPPSPKAPAVAPTLKATPPSSVADEEITAEDLVVSGLVPKAVDVNDALDANNADDVNTEIDPADEPIDVELAQLADDNLDVVEPCDEIEEVVALPLAEDAATKPVATKPKQTATELKKAASTKTASLKATSTKTAALKDGVKAKKTAKDGEAKPAAAKAGRTKTSKSASTKPEASAPGLFDALRKQSPKTGAETPKTETPKTETERATVTTGSTIAAPTEPAAAPTVEPTQPVESAELETAELVAAEATAHAIDFEAQRDAVIQDAARQIERRLKRALADEQNDLLASIRSADKKGAALSTVVGDLDEHVRRYVVAINEVAVVAYSAGADLMDAEPRSGELPAGAVEELLAAEVVDPIRARLEALDALEVDSLDLHVDPVRAFYRQRKTDYLGPAADRLAQLLCVAGVCDSLPSGASLPWLVPAK